MARAGEKIAERVWYVPHTSRGDVKDIQSLQTLLYAQRGLVHEAAPAFFQPDFQRDSHDPYLLHDMDKVVARILAAQEKGERIVVYGDYDVDGVTSTAIMVEVLRRLGLNVSPFLPHRFAQGYGLHLPTVQRLAKECDLLITVDCGISNQAEVAWLHKHKKNVIIIDHHEIDEAQGLPPAFGIIHPRHPAGAYPFGWLSGAGVAFKVCQALLSHPKLALPHAQQHIQELLDLVVLGTVADVVPLLGENRLIVSLGLPRLRTSRRPGLQLLLSRLRLAPDGITADDIGWKIAPRLNAAGKVDHAQPALDLLLAKTAAEAEVAARALETCHLRRQQFTRLVLSEVEEHIDTSLPVIFAANPAWPAGVVGVVASRLADTYARPAVVIGGNGEQAVGSARAPLGMNVLEILKKGEAHVLKLGGHARAAGFSLTPEALADFEASVQAGVRHLSVASAAVRHYADMIIHPRLVAWDTWTLIEKFAPFGEGNRRPTFIARGLEVVNWRPVGGQRTHAKCTFMIEGEPYDGIGFGLAPRMQACGAIVDGLFELQINNFRGRQSLELTLKDVAPTGTMTVQPYAVD